MKLTAENEIRLFNRVIAAITKNCTPGSLYHPEQSARDVMEIFKTYECPFFDPSFSIDTAELCPICGSLGGPDDDYNCIDQRR